MGYSTEDRSAGVTLTDAVVRSPPHRPWPTATARDWKSGASHLHEKNARPLCEAVALENQRNWPTVTASVGTGFKTGNENDVWRPSLQGAVQGKEPYRLDGKIAYPTPTATSYGSNVGGAMGRTWATPRASDGDHGPDTPCEHREGGVSLVTQMAETPNAALWPTAQARDEKGPTGMEGRDERSSLSDAAMPGAKAGRLNPAWVSSLMGFPSTWLDISGRPAAAKRNARGSRRA